MEKMNDEDVLAADEAAERESRMDTVEKSKIAAVAVAVVVVNRRRLQNSPVVVVEVVNRRRHHPPRLQKNSPGVVVVVVDHPVQVGYRGLGKLAL